MKSRALKKTENLEDHHSIFSLTKSGESEELIADNMKTVMDEARTEYFTVKVRQR